MIVSYSNIVDESNVKQLKLDLAPVEDLKVPEFIPITENDGKDFSNIPMVIQNEVEHEVRPSQENDEDFDLETFKFFQEYIKTHQNHPVREKVERMFVLLNADSKGSYLTNKVKNEILRNLKNEYLAELEKIQGNVL
jgi:hypothetical protein